MDCKILFYAKRACRALFLFMLLHGLVTCQDITFTQAEGQASGSFVGSIATSPNIISMVGESDRASLQYSILTSGFKNSEYFQMDRDSGNISFNGVLDREKICPFTDDCSISFSVAVRGNTNFFSTLSVKVVITDENDNRPEFPESSITIHISESANPSDFSQPLVTATDADRSDRYSINDYTITPDNPKFEVKFSRNLIGTQQVSLRLKQKLNREDVDVHSFTVQARDGGNPPKTSNLVVNIVVDDINDNEPVFSQTFYTANFSENMGNGYLIIRISATDDDIGDNGRITYSLSHTPNTNIGVSGKIFVNSSTGQVVLMQSLKSGLYDILIDAHDNGNPRKSNQAVVRVNVLDTSNNKPVVTVNTVQLGDLPLGYVSEMEQPSAVVAVLNVVDPDSGKNGNVTCETSETHFQLQQLQAGSFKLMVAKQLDREKNSTHEVSVTCRDQGSPSLNDTVTITIRVADANDNEPVFTKTTYTQNIIENNIAGDTITFVNAFDIDEGDNALIEYELEDQDVDFLITPDSGIIKAKRIFDREDTARYEFKILAIDHGSPRLTGTATMIVNIKDVNDVSPKFTKEAYTFYYYENRDPESIVGNVSVSDADEGQGGVVSLSLLPMHEEDSVPFAIDSKGRISSLYSFDREEKESYNFYVVGVDNGQRRLSSSAQIIVSIVDVNDNSPSFIFPSDQNDSAFVNIPIQLDQVIAQIDVSDRDATKNKIITYRIINTNSSDLFRIGKFSGQIIANRDLGSPDIGTYSITVNATDQGLPVLWQARTLHLVIQSESAVEDEVIADKNVLIVACIVCFTVIVSGAVLVAMCVLRRMDRQKKLQYAATSHQGSDNGSLPDHSQQYDLTHTSSKQDSSQHEKNSPYHQQTGHSHFLSSGNHGNGNINSGNKRNESYTAQGFIPHNQRRGDNSSCRSEPPPFYLIGPNGKVPDTNLHRHDDFQSTSSAETATGDSGHGSDEDLSNSLDQSNTPTVSMEPSANPSALTHHHPMKSSIASSDGSIQSKLISSNRLSSGKPLLGGKGNSVRFDPRVTDIYDNRKEMPEFHAKLYFSGNSNSNSSSNNKNNGNIYPQNNNAQTPIQIHSQHPLRQTLPYSKQDGSMDLTDNKSKSRLVQPILQQQHHHQLPPYQPHSKSMKLQSIPLHRHNVSSPLSHSSNFNEDANDDSDLNTTTSGSYSVASDDVARESALMMANSNDMYV